MAGSSFLNYIKDTLLTPYKQVPIRTTLINFSPYSHTNYHFLKIQLESIIRTRVYKESNVPLWLPYILLLSHAKPAGFKLLFTGKTTRPSGVSKRDVSCVDYLK